MQRRRSLSSANNVPMLSGQRGPDHERRFPHAGVLGEKHIRSRNVPDTPCRLELDRASRHCHTKHKNREQTRGSVSENLGEARGGSDGGRFCGSKFLRQHNPREVVAEQSHQGIAQRVPCPHELLPQPSMRPTGNSTIRFILVRLEIPDDNLASDAQCHPCRVGAIALRHSHLKRVPTFRRLGRRTSPLQGPRASPVPCPQCPQP